MPLGDRLLEIRWTLRREWFGVWEVRDYYTSLEQRAKAGAEITFGYILMVLAAAALATGGLLLNNPAVVIGSMCVAPFLGPSRAVCIGGLFRNRKIFLGGLVKQLFGLLIIGTGMACAITALLQTSRARDRDHSRNPVAGYAHHAGRGAQRVDRRLGWGSGVARFVSRSPCRGNALGTGH
ncbi:MAG: hypothetical protein V3T92_04745 [Anaerolineae bacterium]